MRILIIDNDAKAARRLEKLLHEIAPGKQVTGRCGSVKKALQWFSKNVMPDLIFSVVELPDGLSFEIFHHLKNHIPVVFTCQHEKYAIDAFKENGIHYIVKPVNRDEIKEALDRYEKYFPPLNNNRKNHTAIQNSRFQERFLVMMGRHMKLVKAEDIAYFYTENKMVYLVTFDKAKYRTNFTLDQLEQRVSPFTFFRINRQFIINIAAIVKLTPTTKSRLQVLVKPETNQNTTTSSGRTDPFCKWMLGGFSL